MAQRNFSVGEREEIVSSYRESGMRQKDFCASRGISVSGLQNCLKRVGETERKEIKFIEISPPKPSRPILEVSYADGTVVKVG